MHECGCNEDAGAKVPGEEEETVRNREFGKAFSYDGEGTC